LSTPFYGQELSTPFYRQELSTPCCGQESKITNFGGYRY
jgi:hypothetical protein